MSLIGRAYVVRVVSCADGHSLRAPQIFCEDMEDYELGEALRGDITDNPLDIYMRVSSARTDTPLYLFLRKTSLQPQDVINWCRNPR